MIEQYVKNTHAETHTQYELEVLEVSEVDFNPLFLLQCRVTVTFIQASIIYFCRGFSCCQYYQGVDCQLNCLREGICVTENTSVHLKSIYVIPPMTESSPKIVILLYECNLSKLRNTSPLSFFLASRFSRWTVREKAIDFSHSKSFTIAACYGMDPALQTTLASCLKGSGSRRRKPQW